MNQPNAKPVAENPTLCDEAVEFVSDDPREANTEVVFPAIFGTVLMVMIMSLIVTPLVWWPRSICVSTPVKALSLEPFALQ